MDYAALLRIWGRADSEVFALFRTGSRVYGTAHPHSDEDFIAVLTNEKGQRDLIFRKNINIVVYTRSSFQGALDDQSLFAIEAMFLPPEHRLKEPRPPFTYKLDKRRLTDAVTEKSLLDYEKAKKTFKDEPGPAKKKLFHSLRLLLFALQLIKTGRIEDYHEASLLWSEIKQHETIEWSELEEIYGPRREELSEELSALAKRR